MAASLKRGITSPGENELSPVHRVENTHQPLPSNALGREHDAQRRGGYEHEPECSESIRSVAARAELCRAADPESSARGSAEAAGLGRSRFEPDLLARHRAQPPVSRSAGVRTSRRGLHPQLSSLRGFRLRLLATVGAVQRDRLREFPLRALRLRPASTRRCSKTSGAANSRAPGSTGPSDYPQMAVGIGRTHLRPCPTPATAVPLSSALEGGL